MEVKNQKAATLLQIISSGSTDEARALLEKYGQEPAKNIPDLEMKLAKLYTVHPDKLEIEKAFAQIHPHKDFIMKHNQTDPKVQEAINDYANEELKSNCAGGCSGSCGKMMSSADGMKTVTIGNDKLILAGIGVVGVLGIVALCFHYNKK